MIDIEYKKLVVGDSEALSNVRLATREKNPHSFTVTEEEERSSSNESAEGCLKYYASRNDACAIGAWDSALVGVIGIERYQGQTQKHKARIWGPYVIDTHRRNGIGTSLLKEALIYAQSIEGVELVSLETSEASENAIRLFINAGFIEVGREPRALKYEEQYYSVIRMQREIST